MRLVLSCEHGGNRVPAAYRPLFRGASGLLASHRGYDLGALPLARMLARDLSAPLVAATVTRLLVDLNRAPNSRGLFSELTRRLPESERAGILARHYLPYRARVEGLVLEAVRSAPVMHLSIHSFTPVLAGRVRDADLGLLYDPAREGELDACRRLRRQLHLLDAGVRVRLNYPYRGTSDGFTRSLRLRLGADRYLGIEVELNQSWATDPERRRRAARLLVSALQRVVPARR